MENEKQIVVDDAGVHIDLDARRVWIGVFIALVVGGYLFYYVWQNRTLDSSTSSRMSPPQSSADRLRLFIESEVAAHTVVLFLAADGRGRLFRSLFDALSIDHHVVDLARTAHGQEITHLLQMQNEPVATDAVATPDKESHRTEFLFVDGSLVGTYSDVRELLLAKKGTDVFGDACSWDRIRVDPQSEAGFMIMGPMNCFQSLADISSTHDVTIESRLETRPLRTLMELETIDLLTPTSPLVRSTIPVAERSRQQVRRSKLLVCHDMKGGYLEDRFLQGSTAFDAYRFYQWDLVDLFVYFGHALVCIPPVGWIAAGHRHGTRVLGTFITEGENGTAIAKQLFKDRSSAEMYASKLAAVAYHVGFDGWLINLENEIPEDLIPNVYLFLRVLRLGMKRNNRLAQVIWYGCVAPNGQRKHQVRLDMDGAPFFQHIDGFYTDYGWNLDDAKYCAAYDLDRRYDIYMGIDVYGRHDTYGGGKMNCNKALRAAWNSGVSAALFAPGWTHKCLQHETKEDFVVVEDRFWKMVRTSWKPRSPSYDVLGGKNCFYSAFNTGRGIGTWIAGEKVNSSKWSNLYEMDIQPTYLLHAGEFVQTDSGSIMTTISNDMAFHGGSSLLAQGNISDKAYKAYFKLFDVDIEVLPRRVIEVSYTTISNDSSVMLLVLTLCPGINGPTHQLILRSTLAESSKDDVSTTSTKKVGLSSTAGTAFGKHFLLPVATEIFPTTNYELTSVSSVGWVRRTYRIGGQLWDQKHIMEIGILCTKKAMPMEEDYLGYLGDVCIVGCGDKVVRSTIRSISQEPKHCKNAIVTAFERIDHTYVSLTMQWDFDDDGDDVRYVLLFLCDHRTNRRTLIGKSFTDFFHVSKCIWERNVDFEYSRRTIELQSVSWTGSVACSSEICQLHLEE